MRTIREHRHWESRWLVAVLLFLASPALAQVPSRTMPATVVQIIDGDTLDVVAYPWPGMTMSTRVRMLGVDTPETYRPGCERERDLGRLATAYVRSSVGEQIWLTEIQDEPDKFGRLLARVVTENGIDVGRELIRQGLATVWPPPEGWDWCGP